MKRVNFIKTTLISGVAFAVLPQLSFTHYQYIYTRDQLIGKGNFDFSGTDFKMQKDTFNSFIKMKVAAIKENIDIEVVSAYRSFKQQKKIFEDKYLQYTEQGLIPSEAISKIIEYSTIPGTSRHHWGTDVDIIDANTPRPKIVLETKHFHGDGPYCNLKEWLTINANSFGFYEVYTDTLNRKGFKYEPWHFSYAPASKPMLQAYKKLDIKKILQEENISGSEYFTDSFISKYKNENILDINPKLL